MVEQLEEVRKAGFQQVRLEGEGDVAEICRLTCLEQHIAVVDHGAVPWVKIRDLKVIIEWNEGQPAGQAEQTRSEA